MSTTKSGCEPTSICAPSPSWSSPSVGAQRQAVAQDHRPSRAPVLVLDLGTVGSFDRWHSVPPWECLLNAQAVVTNAWRLRTEAIERQRGNKGGRGARGASPLPA